MSEIVFGPQHVLAADTYSLAGTPQSSQWLGYRQGNRGIVVRFQVRKIHNFIPKVSKPRLGPNQFLIPGLGRTEET
jgi:hypothetical protein